MKRSLALILVLVMLIGLVPMQALASENETNPWEGRSAVFVGDSITAGVGTTKTYYEYLEESLGFDSVTPMGVAGSCISAASDYGQSNQPLINRYQDIPSADLIVIFMGTNDYGHETPLGSADDTQDGTFYGALNVIIPALVAKHSSSKIVFVTPLHRYGFGTSKILGTQFTSDDVANGVGATLGDYVDALKTVCAANGVSVIDLHTECTLDPTDAEVRGAYMPDGLHPNAAGHEVIAGIMESYIRGIEPMEQEPVELTEMVYGNRFAVGNNQTCRASSRINYYLKAGTVITLKNPDIMQWACTKTSDESSSSNLGYFPDSGWSDKETAVVEADGWVGFVFKYRDETQVFDLTKPLSDYITIEEPHIHTYENGICTGCGEATPTLVGKTISILGASMSTYTGVSNNPDYNSTIGNNAVYYTEGKLGVYMNDTWWMQAANDLGLRLLVNNSWSGSSLLYERNGTVGAYVDRCVQLHNNEGEMPDIIAIQMGTNDFQYYKDTLGTADIDYAALITENEDGSYTYAKPTTSLEAAAIVLHKISIHYPDAEVYYLNISQRIDGTDELIRSFNAELKQVVEHFGAHIVDIYGSAITMADFDTYIGDGRVHPNCLGMDAYTEAFKRALLANTAYEVDTHTVSLDLDGVTADYGDDKIVVSGDAFSCKLTAEDGKELSVSVTMGGEDITDTTYENGTISIESVTDDVVITAEATVHKPQNYRWEFDGTDLACVSGGNALTKISGTTTDGVFSKTSYTLENEVVLMHDLPWIVEWKCEGTFLNTNGSSGARIFTSDNVNANYNARYIFKSNTNGIIAMGEKDTNGSHNYGIALADHGIDWTELHTYRLENRIAADGANMIYLLVDGEEIGPMNQYYIGTKDQNTTSDWLSGKDFVFPYMGTDTHGFTNASIEYIQVWEDGHSHTYENGVCTSCGAAQPGPVITQQPVNGEAKLGERYCVTVEAEGEGLTYQWYLRNAGSRGFSKSSVKDNTYDDVMTETRAGREIYCVITDANGKSVVTNTVKLVLLPSEELAIVTQPTDGEAVLGDRYCVTVEAKGESLKYQWYFRNKGATHWTKSGVTDNTYDDVMTPTRAGREVYCVITDLAGNKVTTDTVKLVRIPVKLEIISQPTDTAVCFDEMFCSAVVAKGDGLKYQWYWRNAGVETWKVSGQRDNTYDDVMTKARNNREIYCVITDAYGNKVATDIVKLTAIPKIPLTLLGQSYESAAMGERYCVTVEAQGEGLTYQWYFRNAGSKYWYKSSVRDNTYDDVMTKSRANREVYCVITDACGNQIRTETVTLKLNQ